ncbi:hypothetical protein [Actinomadura sp. 3N508]|uniref:hypothetical protein n=1 Tax=Actinomadura sp. 3N508 TaxID=3375153 RepID=UPI0037B79143
MKIAKGDRNRLGLTVRLATRFSRSRALARSTSIMFLVALFLMAMYVTLGTLSLSGRQVAERDLGRYGASAGYGSLTLRPGDESFLHEVTDRLRRAGISDAEVMLSTDLQVATTPVRDVALVQADWSGRPYGGGYRLLSGRWPSAPGEVVVTEPDDLHARPGGTLPVMGGQARLRVVGTADDRYAHTSNVLAAPATWAAFPPSLAGDFPDFRAQPYVMWSGRSTDRVIAAVTAEVAERRGDGGDPDAVAATVMTRDQLASQPEKSWIDRSPAGYTVPSVLLPLGAMFLVFGIRHRRFRQTLTVLRAVGVSPAIGVASLTLATLLWALGAVVVGGALGTGIGALARMVISQVRDEASGPIAGLATAWLRLAAVVIIGAVCAGVALGRTGHTARQGTNTRASSPSLPVPESRRRRFGRDARHVLTAVAWAAVILVAAQVDSPAEAMMLSGVLTVAVLLMIPDVVAHSLRTLPERGPRERLALRQLASDSQRVSAAVAILTVLTGASLGYVTLLNTIVRTLDEQAHSDVHPGQVLVTDPNQAVKPPPQRVDELVKASVPPGTRRFQLRYLITMAEAGAAGRSINRQGSDLSILAVDSDDQIEHLVGHALTPSQHRTLRSGGLLIWSDSDGASPGRNAQIPLDIRSGDTVLGRTPPLPVATADVAPAGWRDGTGGVLLTSRARQLRLPISGGAVMYSRLTQPQADALYKKVADAGLNAKAVKVYTPPPPVIPHAGLVATAVGLVVLVLLASLTATRAQTRALRRYLGQLVSIGLPTSWARQVLLYQHGFIITLSTLLGAFIAITPVLVVTVRISGFALSIPWSQLLVLTGAIYLAVLLAALQSIKNLRANDLRSTDP